MVKWIMGSLGRKMARRKAQREKKLFKKEFQRVQDAVNSTPKVCGECGVDFDNTDKDMLNQWRVAVYEDGRVHLTCPSCGPTPEEIEESLKDEQLQGKQ